MAGLVMDTADGDGVGMGEHQADGAKLGIPEYGVGSRDGDEPPHHAGAGVDFQGIRNVFHVLNGLGKPPANHEGVIGQGSLHDAGIGQDEPHQQRIAFVKYEIVLTEAEEFTGDVGAGDRGRCLFQQACCDEAVGYLGIFEYVFGLIRESIAPALTAGLKLHTGKLKASVFYDNGVVLVNILLDHGERPAGHVKLAAAHDEDVSLYPEIGISQVQHTVVHDGQVAVKEVRAGNGHHFVGIGLAYNEVLGLEFGKSESIIVIGSGPPSL